MDNLVPSDKVIQLLLDSLFPISNSINIILDNLTKISNEEIEEGDFKDVTKLLLNEISETLNVIKPVHEVVQNRGSNNEFNEKDLEVLWAYHVAVDDIIDGFDLMLAWIKNEDNDESILNDAINELFNGAKKTINLVNEIL